MVTAPSSCTSPPTHVVTASSRLVAESFSLPWSVSDEYVLSDGQRGTSRNRPPNERQTPAEVFLKAREPHLHFLGNGLNGSIGRP